MKKYKDAASALCDIRGDVLWNPCFCTDSFMLQHVRRPLVISWSFIVCQVMGNLNFRNVRDVRRLGFTPCLAARPLRTILASAVGHFTVEFRRYELWPRGSVVLF